MPSQPLAVTSGLKIICHMYVAALQCLNYSGQELKKNTHNFQFVSNKPLNLKQAQGHQTWYGLADLKQGYSHAV